MRFSIQLPTDRIDVPDEFLHADAIAPMARCIEAAGFDACFVTDHPAPPRRWIDTGGHHTLDPFVALSFAAAATRRLRLQTHVLIAAYRNPFLTAKAVASLDRLSGGRAILGIAAGYLKGEFAALGVDFDTRNERSDEAIRTIRRIWSEDVVTIAGSDFDARDISTLPRPVQAPHPPIWIGGNSKRAIRRAVELGDAWLPFPNAGFARHVATARIASLDDLRERVAYLREHEAEVGRSTPLEIGFVPFGFRMFDEGRLDGEACRTRFRELEELGVGWVTVSAPVDTRAAYEDWVARFGDEVIAKY